MHKIFSAVVFVFDLVIGIVACAALYASDLSVSVKLLVACAFFLFVIHQQSAEILGGLEDDLRIHLLTVHVWQIHQKLGGTNVEWNEIEAKALEHETSKNRAGGAGVSAVYILLFRIGAWLLVGWFLSQSSVFKALVGK